MIAIVALALTSACGTRLSDARIESAGAVGPLGSETSSDGSGSGSGSGSDAGGSTSVPGAASGIGSTTGAGPLPGAVPGTTTDSQGPSTATGGGAAASASTGGTSSRTGSFTGSGSTSTGHAALPPILGGSAVSCKPATGSPVNLGNVSTLSGVFGEDLSPTVPALQTFVKSQNACGGLNGHVIKLTIKDDQDDPATAASQAQDLIQNEHIIAFLGNIEVLTIDAVAKVADKRHVPIVGGDITNDTWFTHPYLFPQGSAAESVAYGYMSAFKNIYKKKVVADVYCIEVPQACGQIDAAVGKVAPTLGLTLKGQIRVSVTAPSYTQQCLSMKDDGVEAVSLTLDGPSQVRVANSCASVGFTPQYADYPLGVGNENILFGNKSMAGSYVPMQVFPWMAAGTPAQAYYQASVKKFNPGFKTGNAASLVWTSGALLVKATRTLSDKPTAAEIFKLLHANVNGDESSTLGGLTAPLDFSGSLPKVKYCLFGVQMNSTSDGWTNIQTKPTCTTYKNPGSPG